MRGGAVVAAWNLTARAWRRALGRGRWLVKVADEGQRDARHTARRLVEAVRDRGVNTVKAIIRRVRRPVRVSLNRVRRRWDQEQLNRVEWGIEDEIARLVLRDRTLVVGPWLSEVGFESLYWIPFLRWVQYHFQIDPARVVAVSRGGVAPWYAGIADRYVEMWDLMDPAEFARRNVERGQTKHFERSALDEAILDGVARRIGTREFDVIHPGLMYRLFTLYWSGHRGMGFLDAHLRFDPITMPRTLAPGLLPDEYVAVKFYAARSMPDGPAVRAWMHGAVEALARELPVVLLDTGLVLEDDHADFSLATAGRIISARDWMTPQTNLAVQSEIVAGARAFVGTCGSLAWLGPQLGTDTSAVFVDPKWLHAHLPLAMRAYYKMGGARFVATDVRGVDPLGALALAGIPPPSRG